MPLFRLAGMFEINEERSDVDKFYSKCGASNGVIILLHFIKGIYVLARLLLLK
jgi:hypothetical protein